MTGAYRIYTDANEPTRMGGMLTLVSLGRPISKRFVVSQDLTGVMDVSLAEARGPLEARRREHCKVDRQSLLGL